MKATTTSAFVLAFLTGLAATGALAQVEKLKPGKVAPAPGVLQKQAPSASTCIQGFSANPGSFVKGSTLEYKCTSAPAQCAQGMIYFANRTITAGGQVRFEYTCRDKDKVPR